MYFFWCSHKEVDVSDPRKVIENYIKEEKKDSTILSQLTEKNFHIALIENADIVSIIIFEKKEDRYEYFGETYYNTDKAEYGSYEFKQENNLLILYSKNTDFHFTSLELKYKNIDNNDEILSINDKIKDTNIIKVYILPENYSVSSIQLN